VIIVLLQQGKGANMGATFGGSSQTVFGSEGPMPLLNKVTTLAAVTFMITSISLAYISSHKSTSSVMKDFDVQKQQGNGIERSAEPLPQSGSAPDMPLTPAETPVPQAAPSAAEKPAAVPAVPVAEKVAPAPEAEKKPAEAAAPATQEVVPAVPEKQEKAAAPADAAKTESKEK